MMITWTGGNGSLTAMIRCPQSIPECLFIVVSYDCKWFDDSDHEECFGCIGYGHPSTDNENNWEWDGKSLYNDDDWRR